MAVTKRRKPGKTEDWSKVLAGVSALGNVIQALDRAELNARLKKTVDELQAVFTEKNRLKENLAKLFEDYSRLKQEVISLEEINRQLKQEFARSEKERKELEARTNH